MKGLSKTGIEYGELNWNFYPGCLHKQQGKCPLPNCWAELMWKRRMAAAAKKGIVLPDFHTPRLIPEMLLAPCSRKKPARILVNFMGDTGGDWVNPNQIVKGIWQGNPDPPLWFLLFSIMRANPQHQFMFLTKNPVNYMKWGDWPDNAWLGATVWNQESFETALESLEITNVKAKHKWLSIEPLLSDITIGDPYDENTDYPPIMGIGIDWVVIGGQTNPVKMPEIAWVKEIVEACDAAGIPVWLKDNLQKLVSTVSFNDELFKILHRPNTEFEELGWHLRQELPV